MSTNKYNVPAIKEKAQECIGRFVLLVEERIKMSGSWVEIWLDSGECSIDIHTLNWLKEELCGPNPHLSVGFEYAPDLPYIDSGPNLVITVANLKPEFYT